MIITKHKLNQLTKKWKSAGESEGYSLSLIFLLEELRNELHKITGDGFSGIEKYRELSELYKFPKQIGNLATKIEILHEESNNSQEEKYKCTYYNGCLAYLIKGKKVLAKKIYELYKEGLTNQNDLEKALEEYEISEDFDLKFGDVALSVPESINRNYHKTGVYFGRDDRNKSNKVPIYGRGGIIGYRDKDSFR